MRSAHSDHSPYLGSGQDIESFPPPSLGHVKMICCQVIRSSKGGWDIIMSILKFQNIKDFEFFDDPIRN